MGKGIYQGVSTYGPAIYNGLRAIGPTAATVAALLYIFRYYINAWEINVSSLANGFNKAKNFIGHAYSTTKMY